MDPLDAFPPIPSTSLTLGEASQVERVQSDKQRQRARDDERERKDEEEQSFENELSDAYGEHTDPEHHRTETARERRFPSRARDGPDEGPGQHIDITV